MQILYEYSKYLSIYYSEFTKDTYLEQVKLFLNFIESQKGKMNIIQICNIDRKDIYNYLAFVSDLSKGTIELKIKAIKNFYSFINAEISDYLFKDIKVFHNYIKLPRFLVSSEIRAILNYYTGEKANLIYLFLNTGIRLSEMVDLKVENVGLEEKNFSIKQKGGSYRKVYYNNDVKLVLQEQIGDRTSGKLFPFNRRQIQYIISKAMKKCGIKGSTHTLRHTFATFMYKQTKDILLVKELLGHSSVVSTQVYTHIESEVLRNAVNSNPLANFKGGGKE